MGLNFYGVEEAYWWILSTEKDFRDKNIVDDDEKMKIVSVTMRGRALKWWLWRSKRHPSMSWNTFADIFLWRFKPEWRHLFLELNEEIEEEEADLKLQLVFQESPKKLSDSFTKTQKKLNEKHVVQIPTEKISDREEIKKISDPKNSSSATSSTTALPATLLVTNPKSFPTNTQVKFLSSSTPAELSYLPPPPAKPPDPHPKPPDSKTTTDKSWQSPKIQRQPAMFREKLCWWNFHHTLTSPSKPLISFPIYSLEQLLGASATVAYKFLSQKFQPSAANPILRPPAKPPDFQ